MKRKTFDIIVPLYNPPYVGGTETVIQKWDDYFSKAKMDSDVKVRFVLPFVSREGDVLNESNDRSNHVRALKIFKKDRLVRISGTFFLLAYLLFTRTDNVIVLSPRYINLCAFFKKVFKKKYKIISWIHFSPSIKFPNYENAFRKADYNLAISNGISRQYYEMGIPQKKIFTIYNPIDRSDHVISRSKIPKFVYVGRLEIEKQKNLQELIKGFQLVLKQYNNSILEFWGTGTDMIRLKKIVSESGIAESVRFRGWNSNPWRKINDATALVMTSKFEGLPMSILESAANGVPIISSDIPTGPADEITSKNGYLYELGNTNQLSECMVQIFENGKFYSAQKVKQSISEFYTEAYFMRLINIFSRIG